MSKPLSPTDKKEYAKDANDKVSDFLSSRVDKIVSTMTNDDEKFVWNSPVFSVKYMNPISKTIYGLENSLLLSQLAEDKDYSFPFYITASQGYANGLSNKGEKSDFIVNRFGVKLGYKKDKAEPGLARDEETQAKAVYIAASKLTPVFNIAQFTGDLPAAVQKLMDANQPKATPAELETVYQALLDTMPTPLKRVVGTNHYRPTEDAIYMNPSNLFKSRLHETNTLLHEVSHSYGHESRKNRPSLRHYSEGIEHRAYEELVANLSAQSVIKHYDLNLDPVTRQELDEGFMQNHTTYDASWAKSAYKNNPSEIFRAAKDADRTANTIVHELDQKLVLMLKANPDLKISEMVKERIIAKSAPEIDAPKKTYKKSNYKRK